jgi:hypothetical protein
MNEASSGLAVVASCTRTQVASRMRTRVAGAMRSHVASCIRNRVFGRGIDADRFGVSACCGLRRTVGLRRQCGGDAGDLAFLFEFGDLLLDRRAKAKFHHCVYKIIALRDGGFSFFFDSLKSSGVFEIVRSGL